MTSPIPAESATIWGAEAAWARFVAAARSHDLKILLDIVPNHMSASQHNPWWDDLLAPWTISATTPPSSTSRSRSPQPFRVHLCTLARAYGEAWRPANSCWRPRTDFLA